MRKLTTVSRSIAVPKSSLDRWGSGAQVRAMSMRGGFPAVNSWLSGFTWSGLAAPSSSLRCESHRFSSLQQPKTDTSSEADKTNTDDSGVVVREVSAATFDAEVLQSQQALACVFYANTPTCTQYIDSITKLAHALNADTKYKWLKLCLINGDKNINLASAFSVQRTKLPVTVFVYSGTIVDRLNGFVAEDRLAAVFQKYKLYYEEKANVILGGGQSEMPLAAATGASLADATNTDHLRATLYRSLIGRDTIAFLPTEVLQGKKPFSGTVPNLGPSAGGVQATIEKHREVHELVKAQLKKAQSQCETEIRRLRANIGMDTKKLSEDELMTSYYTAPPYLNAAVMDALEVLYICRQNFEDKNINGKAALRRFHEVTQKYTRASGHFDFRRCLGLAEVMLLRASMYHHKTEGEAAVVVVEAAPVNSGSADGADTQIPAVELSPSMMTIGSDEANIQLFDNLNRWAGEVHQALQHVQGGQGLNNRDEIPMPMPSHIMEEMLGLLRSTLIQVKLEAKAQQQKGGDGAAGSAAEKGKGDLLLSKADRLLGGVRQMTPSTTTGAISIQNQPAKKRFDVLRRFFISVLQCFPDTAESQSYRARLASFLY